MLICKRFKTLLCLKGFTETPPPTPNLSPIFSNSLPTFSLRYSTITSDQHSFTVSYLINNYGFSPETALNVSKRVRFDTPEKPESVLAFFRNQGLSNSQINDVVRRVPRVLVSDPHKTILPKFEFLISKGASSSDIVVLVRRNSNFLHSSLENRVIPRYEFVRRFFQSDKKTLDCVVAWPKFLVNDCVVQNVKLLVDVGVRESNITHLFHTRPSMLLSQCHDLMKVVDEVKELGFDPSKVIFCLALRAKGAMAKSLWNAKVDAFKSWGWSEETILKAFRRNPLCMLTSKRKINEVMRFWVNELGWNSLVLAKMPAVFGYSLEKRIIPRALVVQCLVVKGLRDKNADLHDPLSRSEKSFLEKYVRCFKEERSQLLKLYQEKMKVQDIKENGVASGSYQMVDL